MDIRHLALVLTLLLSVPACSGRQTSLPCPNGLKCSSPELPSDIPLNDHPAFTNAEVEPSSNFARCLSGDRLRFLDWGGGPMAAILWDARKQTNGRWLVQAHRYGWLQEKDPAKLTKTGTAEVDAGLVAKVIATSGVLNNSRKWKAVEPLEPVPDTISWLTESCRNGEYDFALRRNEAALSCEWSVYSALAQASPEDVFVGVEYDRLSAIKGSECR